jgi:pyruvate kinase
MRRAKIVCTLGPASSDPGVIGQLIDEGMNVARINFSHGDKEIHAGVIASVRAEAERRGRPVAVLQDLQGPKIRVGRFDAGKVELEVGQEFLVTTRAVNGNAEQVSTTYAGLPSDVRPSDILLLDDGLLALEVVEVDGPDVHTRVAVGGTLKNNKGINLPGVKVSAPALTEKDIADLRFGQKVGVDFVALSFVRSAGDVQQARGLIAECGGRTPIIAKIERPEAVQCLDEIIGAADGIMVARGDLGVELGPEKVPLIQKRCIEATNAQGKVVITATQMLESMIENQRPTRAEASDVANAVLDGTDALMLSGETASGRYPLLAVRTMARIIEEIESSQRWRTRMAADVPSLAFSFSTNAIAKGACVAAQQVGAKVIACVSDSGGAARFVSEYRPEARIIAFTELPEVYRQLALYWGVESLMLPEVTSFDALVERVSAILLKEGIAQRDELVVQTMAYPIRGGESTNTLHVHRLR